MSKLVQTTVFWNNLHQVYSKSQDWIARKFKGIWEQYNPRAEGKLYIMPLVLKIITFF
jgi:hypothetical protein